MALSLKAMEYFTAVVRHGNIAKAAAELNIAASALSTAVDQVEASFDLELLTRQRARGVQANASGRIVAQKFERLLEDYRAVLAEGAGLKTALSGTLRVGYYAPIAPAFLPQILRNFVPDPSAVTLHLDECDNDSAQEGLLSGAYDVILFVCEDVRPAIEFETLVTAPAYCLLAKDHPLAGAQSVSMAQISKEPLVVLNRPVASAYYRSLLEGLAGEVTIAAYANSTEMVRSLVSAGHGCAILNMQPLTATTYGGGAVVGVPICDPLPALTLAIAYQKSRPRRLVQQFVAACKAHFAEPGPQRGVVVAR
ncbi:MAG: LysR family transcriptional regulator [Sulfitobacter sp.]